MYLHLGGDRVVKKSDIVAIFDLDNTSQSLETRKYLAAAERSGQVSSTLEELPKSFVVCCGEGGEQMVFLSQLNSATLLGRARALGLE